MSADSVESAPFLAGQRVLLWGKPGRVEAVSLSLATGRWIVAVALDAGLRMRTEAKNVELVP